MSEFRCAKNIQWPVVTSAYQNLGKFKCGGVVLCCAATVVINGWCGMTVC